jgi:non-ribosomal peptide synthetase component F
MPIWSSGRETLRIVVVWADRDGGRSVIYEVAAESGQGEVPIGKPMQHAVYILNKKMDPVQWVWRARSISENVARGYLNRNELTAERCTRSIRSTARARACIRQAMLEWQADGNWNFWDGTTIR